MPEIRSLLPKELAPEWIPDAGDGGGSVAGLPEAREPVLPPYGVATPDHPFVELPALADLSFHLLLDPGERVVAHLTYSRGLVLDAEEYGVFALDIPLLYWL